MSFFVSYYSPSTPCLSHADTTSVPILCCAASFPVRPHTSHVPLDGATYVTENRPLFKSVTLVTPMDDEEEEEDEEEDERRSWTVQFSSPRCRGPLQLSRASMVNVPLSPTRLSVRPSSSIILFAARATTFENVNEWTLNCEKYIDPVVAVNPTHAVLSVNPRLNKSTLAVTLGFAMSCMYTHMTLERPS